MYSARERYVALALAYDALLALKNETTQYNIKHRDTTLGIDECMNIIKEIGVEYGNK